MEGSPFTLVNSKGEEIPGDRLGLVLYKRGGTLCLRPLSEFINNVIRSVTAICKEMGYQFGVQWIDDERYKLNQNVSGYAPELYDVRCHTVDWKDCTTKKPNIVTRHCDPWNYLMLSCTGSQQQLNQ